MPDPIPSCENPNAAARPGRDVTPVESGHRVVAAAAPDEGDLQPVHDKYAYLTRFRLDDHPTGQPGDPTPTPA